MVDPRPVIDAGHRLIIAAAIAPFANRIDKVSVYGSRATGRWRPGSDIDLLICGPIGLGDMLLIQVALEESDLPYQVDLMHERDLAMPDIRRAIMAQAVPLFTQSDLRSHIKCQEILA